MASLKPPRKSCLILEPAGDLVMDKWRKVGKIDGIPVPDGFATTGKGSESAMVGREASFTFGFRDTSGRLPLDLISCQLVSPTGSTAASLQHC